MLIALLHSFEVFPQGLGMDYHTALETKMIKSIAESS